MFHNITFCVKVTTQTCLNFAIPYGTFVTINWKLHHPYPNANV